MGVNRVGERNARERHGKGTVKKRGATTSYAALRATTASTLGELESRAGTRGGAL